MPRSVTPTEGLCFLVPLHSDKAAGELPNALGQVLGVEPEAMNSIACAFWPVATAEPLAQLQHRPIVVELVTPDLLRKKVWPVIATAPVAVPFEVRQYEQYRENGWIGAKIRGSGNIVELLSAFQGLLPWDAYADPNYLDELLVFGTARPAAARIERGK